MTDAPEPRKVKCPQCGTPALYSPENVYRPFCSERCRVMDLGAWADESYRIPASPSSSDSLSIDDEYDDDPSDGRH